MPRDRGPYTCVYSALIDSPEYDALSANAAAVWWALKCAPETGMTGIFPVFPEQLSVRSKVSPEWVPGAMQELQQGGWILVQGRWVWIRNHLRFDPSYRPDNEKHVAGLVERMAGLPRIALVCEFIRYYKALGYLPPEVECGARKSIPVPLPLSVPSSVPETVAITVRAKAAANPASSAQTLDSTENRALIDAYNGAFGSKIGYYPGNLKAATRMYAAGYTLDQARTVFEAVHESKTATAAWCKAQNHEFEYLVRPTYRHTRTGDMVLATLDKVLNELSTGRRTDRRPA